MVANYRKCSEKVIKMCQLGTSIKPEGHKENRIEIIVETELIDDGKACPDKLQ